MKKNQTILYRKTQSPTPDPSLRGRGWGWGLCVFCIGHFSFYFQKDSFCLPKRLLLPSKRTPFALQKDSFCNPKGLLLENVKC